MIFQSRFAMPNNNNRVTKYLPCIALLIVSLICCASLRADVIPLRSTATFSADSPEKEWSVPIKSSDGFVRYILWLEPDFDTEHHVVTVELVLQKRGDKPNGPNLLDPTGRRHGLQAYDFAASDLAKGVQKSAFGKNRTIPLKNLEMIVRVVISSAKVARISAAKYQLEALKLKIEVNNINP